MMTGDIAVTAVADLIDETILDPAARAAARLALLERADRRAAASDARDRPAADQWISRARPSFLYVMYALLLWAIPMGLIAAIDLRLARDIAAGMNAYLAGIPEPLYALFGTGYLGYTVAREWGKGRAG